MKATPVIDRAKEKADKKERLIEWTRLKTDSSFSLQNFLKKCNYTLTEQDWLETAPMLSLLLVLDTTL